MKAIKGFEAKKRSGFLDLPPVGAYVAEIQAVRYLSKEKDGVPRDRIELFMDICEGEYEGRFRKVYDDQVERFGSDVKYKAIFRLIPPIDGEEKFDWYNRKFGENLWCVQESNPGYQWDFKEEKLKGKKVGINLRQYLYTYNGKDRETVEIAQFETIDDVRNGKCRILKPRDRRENKDESAEESTDGSPFTEVTSEVNVPW